MADDLANLAVDLSHAGPGVLPFARKAAQVWARHVKDDWRDGAEVSGSYASSYPASISYETTFTGSGVEVEIGPVLGRTPGASAGFLEEGGGGVDGPAHHAGRKAEEANQEDLTRGIDRAVADALRAVGL